MVAWARGVGVGASIGVALLQGCEGASFTGRGATAPMEFGAHSGGGWTWGGSHSGSWWYSHSGGWYWGHSGGGGSDRFDPVAVGFAFDGAIRADGTMEGYRLDGDRYEPTMTLVVVGRDFLYGDEDQSCTFTGAFEVPLASCDLPNTTGADTWSSYVTRFRVDDTTCDGRLEPQVVNGLRNAFDGMSLGISFGPLTPALEDAWTPETLQAFGSSLSTMYVSIVDDSGGFVGDDWSTGVSLQWDPSTTEVVEVGNNPVPVEASTDGLRLDEAYVHTNPYTYVDFSDLALLDLDTPVDPCGDGGTGGSGDTGTNIHSAAAADSTPDEPPPTDDGAAPDGLVEEEAGGGCGCASGGATGWAGLGVGALLAVRRRRVRRG